MTDALSYNDTVALDYPGCGHDKLNAVSQAVRDADAAFWASIPNAKETVEAQHKAAISAAIEGLTKDGKPAAELVEKAVAQVKPSGARRG